MITLWKSRLALWIVAAEIIVGLLAGSAFACPASGGARVVVRHAHPVKKVHVHRVTPVTPVAPAASPVRLPGVPVHQAAFKHPHGGSAPSAAPGAQFPVELLDVRLVDVGNAEAGQGPRFRVVIKNAMPFPLSQPFEVLLSGGIDNQASPELPTAVQGIQQLAPGEIAPVELRLPVEVMAMAYPGRQEPAPFSVLHVLIAGPKNALGSSSITTLASLPLGEVRLVDLMVAPPANGAVPVGSPLELQGEGFGPQPGQVVLNVAGLKLSAEVLGWSEVGIAVRMPQLALTEPTPIQVVVLRADGQPARPLSLTAVLPTPNAVQKGEGEAVPFPQAPQAGNDTAGPFEGFGPPPAAPANVGPQVAPPVNIAPQPLPPANVAPQPPVAEPAAPENFGSTEPPAQEPLTLAQAFGGLGLPPSGK